MTHDREAMEGAYEQELFDGMVCRGSIVTVLIAGTLKMLISAPDCYAEHTSTLQPMWLWHHWCFIAGTLIALSLLGTNSHLLSIILAQFNNVWLLYCSFCRWQEVQSAAQNGEQWVGALMDPVEVDDWGKFKFILVRMRDRNGRQRQLVRGSNYASQAQLVEKLHRQVRGN